MANNAKPITGGRSSKLRAGLATTWKEFTSNSWLRVAAASVLLCAYLPHYLAGRGISPPVGFYIAALGGLAAAVTLRKEPSSTEKAFWVIAITILMVAEMHSLYVAEDKHNQETRTISEALNLTNKGLKKTLDGLDEVVGKLQGISGDITEATKKSTEQFTTTISEMTGGKSYIVFQPGFISGPVGVGTPNTPNGMMVMPLGLPKLKGGFSLHGVNISLLDHTGWYAMDYGDVFPTEIGRVRQGLEIKFDPSVQQSSGWLYITCSTGSYFENVIVFKVGDQWAFAFRVYKGGSARGRLIDNWKSANSPKNIPEDYWNWHK